MERRPFVPVLIVVFMIVVAAIVISSPGTEESNDRIYQIGTLEGLLNGDLGGKITVGELLEHGSYGLGTFSGLDGEMIVIDGDCYRVAADGSVSRMPPGTPTPFASVTDLNDDEGVVRITAANYTGLKEQLLSALENDQAFCMFVIHSTYSNVTVRSVPGQQAPYPPLADIIEQQSVYHLEDVTGTLIGFYAPPYIGTVDQAGFHFHFISDDRTLGGHVLDMELSDVDVMVDQKMGLDLDL
ncbi:MAG: acetolactate decarboxylase [Euryarchaeota archaeon]|nr:acetolactate decarboxylase [Euryarchaeota archaeon]